MNYNTGDALRDVLPAVRRFSDPDLEILVLDNASTDDSWVWLSSRPYGIRAIRLPMNVGHGRALDLGFLLARTSLVVTLDSDAFPFSSEWLDVLLDPLVDPHLKAAGAWGKRDRLHPACAAYRRQEVLQTEISFHNYKPHLDAGEPPHFGVNCYDTGEFLSRELGANRIALLPVRVSENGWGEVIGETVYHHRAMTGYDTDSLAVRRQRRQLWDEEVRSRLG